ITRTISKAKGPPRIPEVYLLPPPRNELSKKKVSLTCMITGFYPADINVEWDSSEPSDYKNTPPVFDTDGSFFLYSRLKVDTDAWNNGESFTCSVMHEALPNHVIQKSISRSPG
uniref:IGG1 PFC' FC n=1 Tax=Cavia porcellus TaxID=10141 RepID=UPI0000112940|nr:Chain A, IGG1 PFC' FC [Cavia porcellus]